MRFEASGLRWTAADVFLWVHVHPCIDIACVHVHLITYIHTYVRTYIHTYLPHKQGPAAFGGVWGPAWGCRAYLLGSFAKFGQFGVDRLGVPAWTILTSTAIV